MDKIGRFHLCWPGVKSVSPGQRAAEFYEDPIASGLALNPGDSLTREYAAKPTRIVYLLARPLYALGCEKWTWLSA